MERRDFIKQTALGSVGAAAVNALAGENKGIPKRPYGKTGIELSIIGFGGIVVTDTEPSQAAEYVKRAVERGVNYFDVAPSYGNAEERLGPALKPYRDQVFLACKTTERAAGGANKELRNSLKLMQTDHFDLYQLHALSKMEDLDTATGKGGAMETYLKAKEEGLIKHIGFSAHSAEVALEALNRYDFDSVLFPFNFVCWHEGEFGPQVLEKAKEKGAARLALKAMAYTKKSQGESRYNKCWYTPVSDKEKVEMALRFTLSLDITAAIPPGEAELFFMALDVAESFHPLSGDEQTEVKELAQGVEPIFRKGA